MFFRVLKTFSFLPRFAVCLWKTSSSTKKNLLVSYAAKLAALCRVCNYVAKVRIFLETTKFFGNYFSKKVGFFTFSVFHFWHLCFSINQIWYYIIYIYFNIYKFKITYYLFTLHHFKIISKPKCQKWKSEKLKKLSKSLEVMRKITIFASWNVRHDILVTRSSR